MKLKKRYLAIWLVFCLLLGIAIAHFGWGAQWNRWFPPIAIAVVVGSALINMGYNFYCSRKINALLPLMEEGRYVDYLAEIEPIRSRLKSQHLAAFCALNMAAAYDNMGEYEQALALLRAISEKKLWNEIRNVYHLNFATCCFHAQQNAEGLAYYESRKDLILQLVAYPRYQPYVEVLKLYVMLETGQMTEAKEQLGFVKEHFDLKTLQDELDCLEEKLNEDKKV